MQNIYIDQHDLLPRRGILLRWLDSSIWNVQSRPGLAIAILLLFFQLSAGAAFICAPETMDLFHTYACYVRLPVRCIFRRYRSGHFHSVCIRCLKWHSPSMHFFQHNLCMSVCVWVSVFCHVFFVALAFWAPSTPPTSSYVAFSSYGNPFFSFCTHSSTESLYAQLRTPRTLTPLPVFHKLIQHDTHFTFVTIKTRPATRANGRREWGPGVKVLRYKMSKSQCVFCVTPLFSPYVPVSVVLFRYI